MFVFHETVKSWQLWRGRRIMYLICGNSIVRCRGHDCSVACVGLIWWLVEAAWRGEESYGRFVQLAHWRLGRRSVGWLSLLQVGLQQGRVVLHHEVQQLLQALLVLGQRNGGVQWDRNLQPDVCFLLGFVTGPRKVKPVGIFMESGVLCDRLGMTLIRQLLEIISSIVSHSHGLLSVLSSVPIHFPILPIF